MKYLVAIVLISMFALSCLAQDNKKGKVVVDSPIECNIFTLKAYSDSIVANNLQPEKPKELVVDFDDLPEKIIIHCSEETKRDKDIILTRHELYRVLQYLSFLTPQINQAWEVDQPKDSK